MQPQFEIPTSDSENLQEYDELFRLYLNYMAEARADVLRTTRPGRERNILLADCVPDPREHFEGSLEAARDEPAKYKRIVRRLRRGYVA